MVFEDQDLNHQEVLNKCLWLAKDYHLVQQSYYFAKKRISNFVVKQVRWHPPPTSWLILNSDGSVFNQFDASCGGIIRDHNGNFILGFSANLGTCSITQAELWGVFYGLLLAESLGCSNLIVEVDSLCAVLLCQNSTLDFHACRPLISAVHNLCSRDWSVTICHAFREANLCADSLAKYGHQCPLGLSVFHSLPSFLSIAFSADFMGCCHERVVAV